MKIPSLKELKDKRKGFADNLVKSSVYYNSDATIDTTIGVTAMVGSTYGTDQQVVGSNYTNKVRSNYFGDTGNIIMHQNLFDTDTYIFATIKQIFIFYKLFTLKFNFNNL